jgi:hypothetical protein
MREHKRIDGDALRLAGDHCGAHVVNDAKTIGCHEHMSLRPEATNDVRIRASLVERGEKSSGQLEHEDAVETRTHGLKRMKKRVAGERLPCPARGLGGSHRRWKRAQPQAQVRCGDRGDRRKRELIGAERCCVARLERLHAARQANASKGPHESARDEGLADVGSGSPDGDDEGAHARLCIAATMLSMTVSV